MKNTLNVTRRQSVNAAINSAIKATTAVYPLLDTALKYAVYFSIADGNADDGMRLYNGIDDKYKPEVKAFLIAHAFFTVCQETKGLRVKRGFKPVKPENLENHKAKALATAESLPTLKSFLSSNKPKAKPTPKPVDAKKRISDNVNRLKKAMTNQPLNTPENLTNAKVIGAIDSFLNVIESGKDLETFTNEIKATVITDNAAAIKAAEQALIQELLAGETARAKGFIAKLNKVQSLKARTTTTTTKKANIA